MSEPKPLDLRDIEQMLGEIMAKKQFPYCKVSAKARQEILYTLLEEVIPEIKHRIKSACEFFLKYWDKPAIFLQDFPEFKEEFIKRKFMTEEGEFTANIFDEYVEWLFKLAFKDVFESEVSDNGREPPHLRA